MTDLNKFVKLYNSLGIELKIIENPYYDPEIEEGTNAFCKYYLSFGADNESKKLDGYSGFYTEIYFDKNKKFLSQEFYE